MNLEQTMRLAEGMAFDEDGSDLKEWFGNSKAVDSAGNPIIVYHGSDSKFEKFSKEKMGLNHHESVSSGHGGGLFFTNNKRYAHHGKYVAKAYLKIEKPLIQTAYDYYACADKFDNNSDEFFRDMELGGYDGVIITSPSGNLYVVREPEQVKIIEWVEQ